MNSVLRIALAYFAMLAVQSWINVAGLLILAAAAAVFLLEGAVTQTVPVLAIIGVALLGAVPACGGGLALRFASTRSLLHLKPGGRMRLLLGTTLALTLLASLPMLPAWLMEHSPMRQASGTGRWSPTMWFQITWTMLAVAWIVLFAFSRSRLAFGLVGFVPVIVLNLGRHVMPLLPGVDWVLAAGVAAWGLFALWYLRTDSVVRPDFPLASGTSFEESPLGRVFAPFNSRGSTSRATATYQYLLGCRSPLVFLMVGVVTAVLFLLLTLYMGGPSRGGSPALFMLPFFSFFFASLGHNTARRARLLWLRTGMDRRGLFTFAERHGLPGAIIAWSAAALLTFLHGIHVSPARMFDIGLFIVVQGLVATVLYYGGLSMTRGWTLLDVALSIVLFLAFFAQIVILQPYQAPSPQRTMIALLACPFVIAAARALAAHRWHALDWRIARLTPLMLKGGR